MKGKFTILSMASIVGPRNPEEGVWSYENGVITKGILRKKSINLATQLLEIHELSDSFRKVIIGADSSDSLTKGLAFSGGSVIIGVASELAKNRKLSASMVFRIILKDERGFNVSTEQSIFEELMRFSGVKFIPSE